MKNILVMGGVGVGLFSATVLGLLASQGRLNYEGTRGVPILSMLFSPPPVDPQAEHGEAHPAEGEAAHDDEHGLAGSPPHPAEVQASEPPKFGIQHEGLGKEEALPYSVGKSALNPAAPAGDGHGGGHGEPAADPHGAAPHGDAAHAAPATESGPTSKLTPPINDYQQQMETLLGQSQYRRGNYFKFPRLDGDISVDELNRYLSAAKVALDRIEKERAQLELMSGELDARQRDIEDRERLVADQMTKVENARTQLDRRVREFESQVVLVQRDELPGLRQYGSTLEALERGKAMKHVEQSWQTEAGRIRILKVLAVMKGDVVNEILAQAEEPKLREIVVERLKVVVPSDKR